SFRFGSPIAQLANVLLATYKDETVPVVGRRPGGRLGRVQRQHPYTVIARTNAGVFDEAAQRVQDPTSPRLHFVGGLAGYPFQRILDAWRLYAERRDEVRDPLLLHFPDFPTMERLAAEVSDLELKQLCRVVRHYGHRIPRLVHQIEDSAVIDSTTASVCLSTAHKVKGLEFDQVRLAEDFPSLVRTPPHERDPEEVNLLYVAATRAATDHRHGFVLIGRQQNVGQLGNRRTEAKAVGQVPSGRRLDHIQGIASAAPAVDLLVTVTDKDLRQRLPGDDVQHRRVGILGFVEQH
ncbi:MAG: ATP-binding domain-containing protein, partial [Alphaproteobacteria bacterium]|nr:ATP-binding domain-containing protein [Alphaproteobacteria bacterium]